MNDDDEFLPYEEDSDAEEQQQAVDDPEEPDYDDDEAFLRGQTDLESDSGWDTGAETDVAASDTDAGLTSGVETDMDDDEELFSAGADPMAFLAGMEQNRKDDQSQPLQPYEALARQRRLNRVSRQDGTVSCWRFVGFMPTNTLSLLLF